MHFKTATKLNFSFNFNRNDVTNYKLFSLHLCSTIMLNVAEVTIFFFIQAQLCRSKAEVNKYVKNLRLKILFFNLFISFRIDTTGIGSFVEYTELVNFYSIFSRSKEYFLIFYNRS